MKHLSILITRYKEPENVVRPLLDSIKVQQGINLKCIEVIIGQDGKEQELLSDKFIEYYKQFYDLKYLKFKHGGISKTRNNLLDKAKGEYVEFCDCDDMFSSVLALRLISEKISTTGFDALFSTFTEEIYSEKNKMLEYVIHKNDCIFVHGKVFRKQFLIDNNIRFKDELQRHEDVYFVAQCYHCCNPHRRAFIDSSFYIWKYNPNSIVRSDPKWLLNTYTILLDSNEALIENFFERGMMEQVKMYSLIVAFNLYYKINEPEFMNPENAEQLLKAEKRFKKFYLRWVDYMDQLPAEKQQRFVADLRNKAYFEGLVIEHITFEDWIEHILNLEDD